MSFDIVMSFTDIDHPGRGNRIHHLLETDGQACWKMQYFSRLQVA